jgi:hypothetical protein
MSKGRFRLALTGVFLACVFAAPAVASASIASQDSTSDRGASGRLPVPSVTPLGHEATATNAEDERFSAPRVAMAPNAKAEDGTPIDGARAADALAAVRPIRHDSSAPHTAAAKHDRALLGDTPKGAAVTDSLVYSGAGALVIASAGLIFLGAYRRLW